MEGDGPQSRRASMKRPWEEDPMLPEPGNERHPESLPPFNAVAYRRSSDQGVEDIGSFSNTRYSFLQRDLMRKKPKYEGLHYNYSPSRSSEIERGIPPPLDANVDLKHSPDRGSYEQLTSNERYGFPQIAPNGSVGPNRDEVADLPENLCGRRRRLASKVLSGAVNGVEYCDVCQRSPELALAVGECSFWLTQLAKTLQRGIPGHNRAPLEDTGCPPIAESGFKQTFDWILYRIRLINRLADHLVPQVPFSTSQNQNGVHHGNGSETQDGPADIMKRRIDVDADDPFNSRADADSSSDSKPHTKRRSVASILTNEDLPPLRSQNDNYPSIPAKDESSHRVSGMNPPPGPSNRQLPSPPGRSFPTPSPTSLSFPSPSPSYRIVPQGVNLPPPSSLHQSISSTYLPPIGTAHSPETAFRDHSAALQHEVSVQKIALSSLQGEHDKLLAAFSRSQTRASALEKKHAVSDTEIISLTEEKMRLQAQVIDLERDVEELSRSRDESRQTAVQEGAQYVEIVKKASHLEELAVEEKRKWNRAKEGMERKIRTLEAGREGEMLSPAREQAISRRRGEMEAGPSSSSTETDVKMESKSEPRREETPTFCPAAPAAPSESVDDLEAEIDRLRQRCADAESTLRTIRDGSRSVERIVKDMMERAESALQS